MGVVILSKNPDFSSVLAEHIEKELAAKVQVVESMDDALLHQAQLIVATEALKAKIGAPLLVLSQKPLPLQAALSAIKQRLLREEWPVGDAVFSLQQKTLTRGEAVSSLTDKEAQLLMALLKNKDGVEKDVLLKEVWGVSTDLDSHTLETHVYRLRAKLKEVGLRATIVAAPGKYILEVSS